MASPSVIRPSSLISSLPPSTSSDCSLRGYRQLGHFHKKDDMKLHIKSKLGGEFRRFTMTFPGEEKPCFNIFITRLFSLHSLDTPELQEGITIEYTDTSDGSHLPIHSDDTLKAAVDSRPSVLRIFLQRRGESIEEQHGYGLTAQMLREARKRPSISTPSDFRRVSAIVDADTLPFTLRRVQLCKYNSNLKLGFFIKQDTSYRNGFPQSGTFVSKLLDHGIAASTNLLHPNDEIIEVNGIDITERSLDQVTDIMIANSYNIILTVLPAGPPYGGIPSPHVSTTHRHEKGLKSYMDMPAGYGTLSSRGSSGENSSPPAYYSPLGRGRDSLNYSSPHLPPYPTMMFPPPPPPMMNHHHLPHPMYLPPMRGMPLHPYAFDHTSFSRNTTVRLSDKIKNEKEVHIRSRRPFSLYTPNS